EPLDGRYVVHDPALEGVLELPVRNLHVLDGSEDVGELKAHELDLLALNALEDLRLRFAGVRRSVPGHVPAGDFSQLFARVFRLIGWSGGLTDEMAEGSGCVYRARRHRPCRGSEGSCPVRTARRR